MARDAPDRPPIPPGEDALRDLAGVSVPNLDLMGHDGRVMNLADLARARLVLYVYPATGVPGRDPAPNWDDIPGAAGCTVQSLGFLRLHGELTRRGITVAGLSAQSAGEQHEFARRHEIPFPLLSDPAFELARHLRLPTFDAGGRRFYRRLALAAEHGRIVRTFHPVVPPEDSASVVLAWADAHGWSP